LDKGQFIELIEQVLKRMGDKFCSPEAVELLYRTAVQESRVHYIKQIKGPARGFFQIEPPTAIDVRNNYLAYRLELLDRLREITYIPYNDWAFHLSGDIILGIIFARLIYYRDPAPIPSTLEEQAEMWKRVYNTKHGKGTVEEFINANTDR
jgi:hypothetical protein